MGIIIKKEKIDDEFFIVARLDGEIKAKRKWSKNFTVSQAKNLYRNNNTFTEGLKKRQLISRPFTEITDTRKKPFIPKENPYRVIVSGLLKDGEIINASSTSSDKSFSEHKEEATESFYERVAQHFNMVYDADEGIKLSDEIKSIKTSVIRVE